MLLSPARVTVQRPDGISIGVVVEEGSRSVQDVKRFVEKVEGVAAGLQDLFVLSTTTGGDEDTGDTGGGLPLANSALVEDGWVLALLVRGTNTQLNINS